MGASEYRFVVVVAAVIFGSGIAAYAEVGITPDVLVASSAACIVGGCFCRN